MLSAFLEWARTTKIDLAAQGLGAEIPEGQASDSPAARLDIATPAVIARVTCWDSGHYDAEVLDQDSGETTYYQHGSFDKGETISEQLGQFFSVLGRH